MSILQNIVTEKLPEELPEDKRSGYANDSIVLFKAYDLFKGPFKIDFYEFLVPSLELPAILIENKEYYPKAKSILPVNPGQTHGACSNSRVPCYIPILIEKQFLNNLARDIFGKADIVFQTDCYNSDPCLSYLISQFIKESSLKQPGYEFILQSISIQIAVSLLRCTKSNLPASEMDCRYSDNIGIRRVIDYLHENYNKKYSFEEVAQIANYSPYHFIKIFKSETGKTPHEFLLDIRIRKASEQLKVKNSTITDICYSCGFNSLNHFTAIFKKKLGVTPSEYKKSIFM